MHTDSNCLVPAQKHNIHIVDSGLTVKFDDKSLQLVELVCTVY